MPPPYMTNPQSLDPNIGAYPLSPMVLRQEKNSEWDKLLFNFKTTHLHCLDENACSETMRWFINPLEELTVTLLTLEVETAWVLLGT